jgi:riboflavin synthase
VFTGLIQTIGTLQPLGNYELKITCAGDKADLILQGLELGDSIAVDGVCLTVAKILPQGFIATASPETLSRTTLGQSAVGVAQVNLEASLRVGSKLGGHFVTGHVDGRGWLESAVQTANAWEMSFQVSDPRVARYIVPKGSIAVNGVSLTVAECSEAGDWFKVAVIPVTYAETNLQYLQPEQPVNLEGDVLGKYVEKFLRLERSPMTERLGSNSAESITPEFLMEHGYFL